MPLILEKVTLMIGCALPLGKTEKMMQPYGGDVEQWEVSAPMLACEQSARAYGVVRRFCEDCHMLRARPICDYRQQRR